MPRPHQPPVRMHWGIENNCVGTLDNAWKEDRNLCCWQGNAPLVLAVLRVMAYNDLGWLRGRHLRSEQSRSMTWRELFDYVKLALVALGLGTIVVDEQSAVPELTPGG